MAAFDEYLASQLGQPYKLSPGDGGDASALDDYLRAQLGRGGPGAPAINVPERAAPTRTPEVGMSAALARILATPAPTIPTPESPTTTNPFSTKPPESFNYRTTPTPLADRGLLAIPQDIGGAFNTGLQGASEQLGAILNPQPDLSYGDMGGNDPLRNLPIIGGVVGGIDRVLAAVGNVAGGALEALNTTYRDIGEPVGGLFELGAKSALAQLPGGEVPQLFSDIGTTATETNQALLEGDFAKALRIGQAEYNTEASRNPLTGGIAALFDPLSWVGGLQEAGKLVRPIEAIQETMRAINATVELDKGLSGLKDAAPLTKIVGTLLRPAVTAGGKLADWEALGLKSSKDLNLIEKYFPFAETSLSRASSIAEGATDNMGYLAQAMESRDTFRVTLEQMSRAGQAGEMSPDLRAVLEARGVKNTTDMQRAIRATTDITGAFAKSDRDYQAGLDLVAQIERGNNVFADAEAAKVFDELPGNLKAPLLGWRGGDIAAPQLATEFDRAARIQLASDVAPSMAKTIAGVAKVPAPNVLRTVANKMKSWQGYLMVSTNPHIFAKKTIWDTVSLLAHGANPFERSAEVDQFFNSIGMGNVGQATRTGTDAANAVRRATRAGQTGTFDFRPPHFLDKLKFPLDRVTAHMADRAYMSGYLRNYNRIMPHIELAAWRNLAPDRLNELRQVLGEAGLRQLRAKVVGARNQDQLRRALDEFQTSPDFRAYVNEAATYLTERLKQVFNAEEDGALSAQGVIDVLHENEAKLNSLLERTAKRVIAGEPFETAFEAERGVLNADYARRIEQIKQSPFAPTAAEAAAQTTQYADLSDQQISERIGELVKSTSRNPATNERNAQEIQDLYAEMQARNLYAEMQARNVPPPPPPEAPAAPVLETKPKPPTGGAPSEALTQPIENIPPAAAVHGNLPAGGAAPSGNVAKTPPPVVYHGTPNAGFTKFEEGHLNDQSLYGPGYYFTDNPRVASGYAVTKPGEAAAVYPARLDIQRAFDINAPADQKLVQLLDEIGADLPLKQGQVDVTSNKQVYRLATSHFGNKAEVNDWLNQNGYDGITHVGGRGNAEKHQVWIAFDNAQIKPTVVGTEVLSPPSVPATVPPIPESPLLPQDLPNVQLTPGQQQAQSYLLSIKRADGSPVYTAEQLALWKPDTLERVAGELQTARNAFDTVMRAARIKGVATATERGVPNNKFLLNVLNKHRAPDVEKFVNMSDVRVRSDEALKILDEYTPSVSEFDVPPPSEGRMTLSGGEPMPLDAMAQINAAHFEQVRQAIRGDATSGINPVNKVLAEQAWLNESLDGIKRRFEQDLSRQPITIPANARASLIQYLGDVGMGMFDAQQSANGHGRWMVDHTVLNYNKRWNIDDQLSYLFPFTYWALHTASHIGQDFIDRPLLALLYAQLNNGIQDQTDPNAPKRFAGQIAFPMPFAAPDWMGSKILVAPLDTLFPALKTLHLDAYKPGQAASLTSKLDPQGQDTAIALKFLTAGKATHPDEADAQAEYDVMMAALHGGTVPPDVLQLAAKGVPNAPTTDLKQLASAIAQSHLDAHSNALRQPNTIYDPYPGSPEKNTEAVMGFGQVLRALAGETPTADPNAPQDPNAAQPQSDQVLTNLFSLHSGYALLWDILTGNTEHAANLVNSIPAARLLRGVTAPFVPGGVTIPGAAGKFDNYYILRQLADMRAKNELTQDEYERALIAQTGDAWKEATTRSGLENYTVPALTSATGFTAKTYPRGEQMYYDQRLQRDRLIDDLVKQGGGNVAASYDVKKAFLKKVGTWQQVLDLYTTHPELGAFADLHAYNDSTNPNAPTDFFKNYLVSKIWETWHSAGNLQKSLWRADLGDEFKTKFDVKTPDYASISLATIEGWANALRINLPKPAQGENSTPDPFMVKFPTPDQNARYQVFYDDVKNTVGWDTVYALGKQYAELKKANPTQAKAWLRTPDGKKAIAIWDNEAKFYTDNPDVLKLMEDAGLKKASGSNLNQSPTQGQALNAAVLGAGLNWDDIETWKAEYNTLPKGTGERTNYLSRTPGLLRYFQLSGAIYNTDAELQQYNARRTSTRQSYTAPQSTLLRYVTPHGYPKTPNLYQDYGALYDMLKSLRPPPQPQRQPQVTFRPRQ